MSPREKRAATLASFLDGRDGVSIHGLRDTLTEAEYRRASPAIAAKLAADVDEMTLRVMLDKMDGVREACDATIQARAGYR